MRFIRDTHGKFAKANSWAERTFRKGAIALGAISLIATGITAESIAGDKGSIRDVIHVALPVAEAGGTTESKIESYKWALVEKLTTCEAPGRKEADAPLVLDTNNEFSFGRWMFQPKTVQGYYKLFYGKQLTRKEAIILALDDSRASELAYKIIWEDKGKGIDNWYNCNRKLGLSSEIAVIKKIEN